jgi:hypothetical protein
LAASGLVRGLGQSSATDTVDYWRAFGTCLNGPKNVGFRGFLTLFFGDHIACPATSRRTLLFMKILFFWLSTFGLLPLGSYAQNLLPDTLRYQQVVPVPGLSADDLYGRAREWAALTFEDVHQAVQLEDVQRHLLLGSGYTRIQTRRPNGKIAESDRLWFSFRIESREGRYRVEIFNLGSTRGYEDYAPSYNLYDLGRWVESGRAVQEMSGRHSSLKAGFSKIVYSPTPQQAAQIRAGLDEAVHYLMTSLRTIETAPAATW